MGRWRFFKLPEYFLEKKDKYRFLLIIILPLKKKLKEVCFFTFLRDISKKSLILIVIEFSFFHTQGLSWDWYYGVCLNFRAYFFLSKPTKQYNNKFSNLRESSWFWFGNTKCKVCPKNSFITCLYYIVRCQSVSMAWHRSDILESDRRKIVLNMIF